MIFLVVTLNTQAKTATLTTLAPYPAQQKFPKNRLLLPPLWGCTNGRPQAWARGPGRRALAPGNVVKFLCISIYSFSQFLESQRGSYSSFDLCFERRRLKKVNFFEEKVHP